MTPAEAALLTARRTRLGDVPLPPGTSMIWTNQRPESRSYRIRGSLVKFGETGVITEAKKLSVVVSRTPSATPLALVNVRSRPLTATTNWLGPTAPIESGGKAPVSASVAPVKVVEGVWATAGAGAVRAAASPVRSSSEAAGCCGRPRIAGTRPGLIVRPLAGRRPAASRAMMAAVVSVTPARPVHGPDSGVAYAGPAARAASQRARAHTPRTLPLPPEGILHRAGGSGSSGSARRSASGTGPRSRPPKLPTVTVGNPSRPCQSRYGEPPRNAARGQTGAARAGVRTKRAHRG